MRILLDTNVVLDVLLDREPFSDASSRVFGKVEQGDLRGYICATTITTVHYLAARVIGSAQAVDKVKKLLTLFEVAAVNRKVLEAALSIGFSDFEDAVIYESARHIEADAVVTRNAQDFERTEIPIFSPDELLRTLDAR